MWEPFSSLKIFQPSLKYLFSFNEPQEYYYNS